MPDTTPATPSGPDHITEANSYQTRAKRHLDNGQYAAGAVAAQIAANHIALARLSLDIERETHAYRSDPRWSDALSLRG